VGGVGAGVGAGIKRAGASGALRTSAPGTERLPNTTLLPAPVETRACPHRPARAAYIHHKQLKRDDFASNRHHALAHRLSMIFSENRHPLFGIML
jgi:hypothetical protein